MKNSNPFSWSILVAVLLIILASCNSQELKIINEEIISSCNILADEGCEENYESTKNSPVKILEENKLEISLLTGCKINLDAQLIQEKEGKIELELSEEGVPSLCGSDFKVMEITTNQPLSLEDLSIYQKNEHLGETKKIYPVE